MSHFVFERFVERNGKRVGVILRDSKGSQEYSVDDVRAALSNKSINVDGLKLDGSGLRVIGRQQQEKKEKSNTSDRRLDMILRELQGLKTMIKGVNTAIIPAKSKENKPVSITADDIKALNQRLYRIEQAIGVSHSEILNLIDKLDSQNIDIKDYVNSIKKDLPALFQEVLDNQEPPFPQNKDDINHSKHYSDNSELLSNVDTFLNSGIVDSGFEYPTVNDREIYNQMFEHLKLINKIRKVIASNFITDIEDKRGVFDTNANKALSDMSSAYLLLAGELHLAIGVKSVQTLGNCAKSLGVAALKGIGVDSTDRARVKRNHKDMKLGLECRPTGVYMEYAHYDIPALSERSNKDYFDSYAFDVRCFVIDMLSSGYKKAFTDFLDAKHIKDRDYYKLYLKGTMCSGLCVNNNDEKLLIFYCKYILARQAQVGDFSVTNRTNDYRKFSHLTSASTIGAVQTLFDLFINAYFMAKKMMLDVSSNENIAHSYDFLNNGIHTVDKKEKMKQFLGYLHLGLLMQDMNKDMALEMIDSFRRCTNINI